MPIASAKARRTSARSLTITWRAPRNFAHSITARPTGPAPWKGNLRGPSAAFSQKAKKARNWIGGARETRDPLLVEAYLLDFDGDLYGQTLRLDFLARLRGERRFESPEALVEQMQRDVERTRELCEQSAC